MGGATMMLYCVMPFGTLTSLVDSCYDVWVDHAMAQPNNNASMSKRMLKVVAFVLLAWTLCGPLIELVDRWDNLRAEIADIACSAGGRLTLILMGASVGLGFARKLRQRCSNFSRNMQDKVLCLVLGRPISLAIEVSPADSPPPLLVSLRI
jgi:hypothetical protein